ncbi:MAG TPA: phosphomannomutase/phosphoglucomutase [bacterium]|nr:phosphomannomutase/phosphoglucomutase [bacterium]
MRPYRPAQPGLAPEIFRECDIRGIFGRGLDVETGEAVGAAFATLLDGAGAVVCGHDNRASSEALYAAAIRGLTGAGRGVAAIGLALTPMMYFAVHRLGAPGGLMVTASHNPAEFNGIKLAGGTGTLYGDQIQRLREIAERAEFSRGEGTVQVQEILGDYAAMLAEKIRLAPRRLRVVVDCGNGTAGAFAPAVLRRWGCDVVPLYCDLDPAFPHHHPDPVECRNLTDLIRAVRDERADLGVGLDGDGDRIGVVDDRGEVLWGDRLMALFWREVLRAHPGAIALVEVKCSQALVDEIRRLGGRPEWTRTGHSLIKARMREVGAVFAGEMSGHMFFADEYYGYDDALYAAGRLLRLLSRDERPLSALAADIPRYHTTPEIRVACPDERKFAIVAALRDEFRRRYEVIDVDGARVVFPDGWALVRASNTQPALVLRAEGTTAAALTRATAVMQAALHRHPEVAAVRWDA